MRHPDFVAIKRLIPPRRLLGAVGWTPLTERSGEARGPCPIHSKGNKRSRVFAVSDRAWYCHKCKTGGDSIDLAAILYNLAARDAAIRLCEIVGLELPTVDHATLFP